MPEYLAPGVYVEETSFRSRSIEGVGTSTTGFVGATRYGPVDGEPELMTSFSQFERIYGGLDPLSYDGTEIPNYLAHAVRGFFDNGGSRLYIARAFTEPNGDSTTVASAAIPVPVPEINTVDVAALGAANMVLSALEAGVNALEQAQTAAVFVLQFAVRQTLSALETVPPPDLNYGYGEGESDIGEQLGTFINGLDATSVPERGDLLDAFTSTWEAVINSADGQLQQANLQLVGNTAATEIAIEDIRDEVGGAYALGFNQGSNIDITGLSPNLEELNTAGIDVNNAATNADDLANSLETPAQTLADSVLLVTDVATAQTAMTNAGLLITAAAGLKTAVQDAVEPITGAARIARRETRIAIANANAQWLARFPGEAGNMTLIVSGRLGANVLTGSSTEPEVRQLREGDLVVIQQEDSATIHSVSVRDDSWVFIPGTGGDLPLINLDPEADARVYPLQLTVEANLPGRFAQPMVWDNLTVSNLPSRQRDSVTNVFAEIISNRLQALETPIILSPSDGQRPAEIASSLLNLANWTDLLNENELTQVQLYTLSGGNDGERPVADAYRGSENADTGIKSGLVAFEDLEEISIIAAPGYSYDIGDPNYFINIQQINQHLISHCEAMRYRVAVLDSPNDQSLSGVREYRALLDNTRAALYYPWVKVLDPVSNSELNLPPSGFMAGIYARSDVEVGVHKAPANEVVRGAIGLEFLINKAQQDVLNPLGINCIRFFEGRGIRVWGARTISSDPEWKYLNIRRYFAYLEASIDRSTQWAVFEPNGERLWANIRRTVESFLENEWREGRLAGTSVEEAFFVRCDRSTMTQNDLDNGRLICLIGVSPLYPAEFVIFRIGQWTADQR